VRPSQAVLSGTPVRLAELRFPARRVHVQRTRLAYIHLDNLLHFAKADRDARVDGYIVAYLPDELAVVFLREGEAITAVAFTERGRAVVPIPAVLDQIRDEVERGELAFCEAPPAQLAWMYQSGAAPARPIPIPPTAPREVFTELKRQRYAGILELIVDGGVSYFGFVDGRVQTAFLCDSPDPTAVEAYLDRVLAPRSEGSRTVAASLFPSVETLVPQASPVLVEAYRDVFWRIAETAEREVPGEGHQRALKVRDLLVSIHRPLAVLSTPREAELAPAVLAPEAMAFGLSDWSLQLLEQLEIIAPGVAPTVLRDATRPHRYVLQRAGFYQRLPWPVSW